MAVSMILSTVLVASADNPFSPPEPLEVNYTEDASHTFLGFGLLHEASSTTREFFFRIEEQSLVNLQMVTTHETAYMQFELYQGAFQRTDKRIVDRTNVQSGGELSYYLDPGSYLFTIRVADEHHTSGEVYYAINYTAEAAPTTFEDPMHHMEWANQYAVSEFVIPDEVDTFELGQEVVGNYCLTRVSPLPDFSYTVPSNDVYRFHVSEDNTRLTMKLSSNQYKGMVYWIYSCDLIQRHRFEGEEMDTDCVQNNVSVGSSEYNDWLWASSDTHKEFSSSYFEFELDQGDYLILIRPTSSPRNGQYRFQISEGTITGISNSLPVQWGIGEEHIPIVITDPSVRDKDSLITEPYLTTEEYRELISQWDNPLDRYVATVFPEDAEDPSCNTIPMYENLRWISSNEAVVAPVYLSTWPFKELKWVGGRQVFQTMKAGTAVIEAVGTMNYLKTMDETGMDFPTPVHIRIPVVVEYRDVPQVPGSKPYYYDAVYWATDEGIAAGYKDENGVFSLFGPNNTCTRAQMVTFLWRMAGCPEAETETTFPDVKKGSYYYKAVSWAKEAGITGGYSDGTFRPQNDCTRAQAVTFLYRMAGCPKVTGSGQFSDVKENSYYHDAVIWAEKSKITGGYSDGTFRPSGKCTRAQMVTFLYRYTKTKMN